MENGQGRLTPRSRSTLVTGLRSRTPTARARAAAVERCDLCRVEVPGDHRHLLQLDERRILCVCEPCWALRSGDAEYRPTGTRTIWLPDLDLPEQLWAAFGIPIGLAFFFSSTVADGVVACYPSPGGATESELPLEEWASLVAGNPILDTLEPDIEGLLVNRLATTPQHAIAPIDRCYQLVGLIRASWEGFSGGDRVRDAVSGFFAELEVQAG